MKSISIKIGLIYILLTIFNISFFTVSIYIQQNELITKNRESETVLNAERVYSLLKLLFADLKGKTNLYKTKILDDIEKVLKESFRDEYLIFNDKGEVLAKSSDNITLKDFNKGDSINAISNKEFLNQPYLLKIYETDASYAYIPVDVNGLEDDIIMLRMKMPDLKENLAKLYRVVITVIAIVLFLQILFGVILYFIIIRPIKEINRKSLDIKEGNLSSRVKILRKDEIGQLGKSFNEMASSIEEKITLLEEKNRIMNMELNAASTVQAGIYPKIRSTDIFNASVYHRPLEMVSGDYHDIFKISNKKYGFLIADVSGHGVPAALMTIRIQDTFKRHVSEYNDTRDLFIKVNTELSDLLNTFSCYFTAFYLSIDAERNITYSSGGHPYVYLFRPRNKRIFELNTDGCFLGASTDVNASFQSKKIRVNPGDKIIMFSDGLIEAINAKDEQYSIKRLMKMFVKNADKPCSVVQKKIIDDLDSFIGGAKRRDDETLIIIDIRD